MEVNVCVNILKTIVTNKYIKQHCLTWGTNMDIKC